MSDTQEEIVDGIFTRDQCFTFPVNEAQNGGSITCIKMTIPAGTPAVQGYTEIISSLTKLGLDPEVILPAMGFNDVLGGTAG